MRRVAALGDDARDERLAGDDARQPLAVDHEDRADLRPDQELAGLPCGGVPGNARGSDTIASRTRSMRYG